MNIASHIQALFKPLTQVQTLEHALEYMEWERDVFRDAMLREQVSLAKEKIERIERQ